GHAREDLPVEAVTIRIEVAAPPPAVTVFRLPPAAGPPPRRMGRSWVEGRWEDTPLVRRRDLQAGHRLEGPAVVMEYSATTWVPPGWRLEVLETGGLLLGRG